MADRRPCRTSRCLIDLEHLEKLSSCSFRSPLCFEYTSISINMSSIVLLAFLSFVVFLLYKYLLYPTCLSPLSKIPNAHFSSSFSPLWMLWIRKQARENRTILQSHEKLGPIVRLAPNELSGNCVDGGTRTIYGGGFHKHEWYLFLFGNFG